MNKVSRKPRFHPCHLNQVGLKLSQKNALQEKPEPFNPGVLLIWVDPHISKQILVSHLDSLNDLTRRRTETIKHTVDWLVCSLHISSGAKILDLGCGPELFSVRLVQLANELTGKNYSRHSIAYANKFAEQEDLDIQYRYHGYLTLEESGENDLALLGYVDFFPLLSEQCGFLLQNVYRSLKPGGYFCPGCDQSETSQSLWK